ncbi:MAG: response regulator [Candidatus Hydrogenedentota bacterium]
MSDEKKVQEAANILVVDDTPGNLKLLSSILNNEGYKVRSVLNGRMALTAAESTVPDLVLLDIHLPDMDGYEVCEKLKKNPKTIDVPVIFISASQDTSGLVKAYSVGGVDYITKPIHIQEVLIRVENQLSFVNAQKELVARNERLQDEIHSREQAELLNRRYKFIVNSVRAMMSVIDADWRYQAVNDAWCGEMDRERSTVINVAVGVVWGEKTFQKEIRPHVTRCFGGVATTNQTWVNLKKTGRRFCESDYFPYYDAGGLVTHVVIVTRDITEEHEAEANILTARDAAESAHNAKSVLLANVSHEIRDPLNVILGFSQLLHRDSEVFTDEQRGHLETIERSSAQLLALMDDLLQISRIETGVIEVTPHNFDLSQMFSDLESMFGTQASEKRIPFEVNKIGEIPQYVFADESKIRHILLNLLSYAVKFTHRGGVTLRVTANKPESGLVRLIVEIENTAPGIPKEDPERIFKHFEQTTIGGESTGGTGLGLAICESFTKMLGGRISVSNRVNDALVVVGSTFRVEIPLTISPENPKVSGIQWAKEKVVRLASSKAGSRILVAYDIPQNGRVLVTLLESVGFEVDEAANGVELISKFEHWLPALIIVDLEMPGMDVETAIERIRTLPTGKNVKIVAVTEHAFEDDRIIALEAGANDFIQLPFNGHEIFDVVAKLLNVSYVYEEESEEGPNEKNLLLSEDIALAVSKLPETLLSDLRTATACGYLSRLKELATDVEAVDVALAQNIRAHAERYEYDALVKILYGEAKL